MLTPINTNTTSPVRPSFESPTHKICRSVESKKLDVELAAKAKSLKDGAKARKESKGPILKRKMACATCRRRKVSSSRFQGKFCFDSTRPWILTCSLLSITSRRYPSLASMRCCSPPLFHLRTIAGIR